MLFSFEAYLPHMAFALQIRQNHGLQTVAPPPAGGSLKALRFSKYLLCPSSRTDHQVLPDFTRSELRLSEP
ncbi:MAG: hypothetical protein JWR38_3899 [Mucilaginibacter sp.]|nr:hypothetical protein [Mucilaginibacter sp.]